MGPDQDKNTGTRFKENIESLIFKSKNMEYKPERHDPHLSYVYDNFNKLNCA